MTNCIDSAQFNRLTAMSGESVTLTGTLFFTYVPQDPDQPVGLLVFTVGAIGSVSDSGCASALPNNTSQLVTSSITDFGQARADFNISVQSACSEDVVVTYVVQLTNAPRGVVPLSTSQTAFLTITAPPPPQFVRPPVISLAQGKSKGLIPLDANCRDLSAFSEGTTFTSDKPNIASVTPAGLVKGEASSGVAVITVISGGQSLNGCKSGAPPLVHVGPLTITLRFLPDTVEYLKARDSDNGLELSDADVQKIINGTQQRVQQLFDQAMANVQVTTTTGNVTVADNDNIMVVDIAAIRGADQRFERAPRRGQQNQSIVLGRAQINHLNLTFGGDIVYDPSKAKENREGVFVNTFPYYTQDGLRDVTAEEIGIGIGNVAAHEAGHRLGLVPNPASRPNPNPAMDSSEKLRDQIGDERFAGWTFDGTSRNHTKEAADTGEIMAWESFDLSPLGRPYVFTTSQSFRDGTRKDREYLRTILPRP